MSAAEDLNRVLEATSPALAGLLSPLGRAAYFPQDIPFQAAEARGTRYNGTIGVFTDGAGHAVPLPSMADALDLSGDERDRAFLYSPVLGVPAVREAWRRWQRTEQGDSPVPDEVPSSLPVVTCGLSHGLSLVADLFGGPGRKLALTTPFWGNYRQVFSLRTGVELVIEPAYGTDRRFDPKALRRALGALPEGEPALALANFPSNPGGYAPTAIERARLVEGLVAEAERRPLAVICDDAYGGLAYAEDAPNSSIFWDLAGLHPNLVPIKIDGATKEFGFFGGRVGFLTFGADLEDEARQAIESKIASLVRSTLGSPVATSQMVLLRSLAGGQALAEVSEIRRIARERYGAVRPALEALDPGLLRLLPFNAGFFVLMELADGLGLDPHDVRRHLIEKHDTGVVSSSPNYLRLAICSVAAEDLPETVRRIEQGVRELAGG